MWVTVITPLYYYLIVLNKARWFAYTIINTTIQGLYHQYIIVIVQNFNNVANFRKNFIIQLLTQHYRIILKQFLSLISSVSEYSLGIIRLLTRRYGNSLISLWGMLLFVFRNNGCPHWLVLNIHFTILQIFKTSFKETPASKSADFNRTITCYLLCD
jgi:hypothetical protein